MSETQFVLLNDTLNNELREIGLLLEPRDDV